jgi:N-formylglutamate amidohydrolase
MGMERDAASDDTRAHPSGDAGLRALGAAPFSVFRPPLQTAPFVFASPHSGRNYPPGLRAQSRLDALTLRKSEDAFVEELFAFVPQLGAPLIAAHFPRVFVDANRAESELDPMMFEAVPAGVIGPRTARVAAGLGVIPRVVRDGVEIYAGRLPASEASFRLEGFYRPYHGALAALVEETRRQFGMAIIIDCHSMPPPVRRSDVVLGDCHGEASSPGLTALAHKTLGELGFSVVRNLPYAGGFTTRLYGRPAENLQALQIEISRALYLDEERMEKTPGFAVLQKRLQRFADRLMAGAAALLAPDAKAAE